MSSALLNLLALLVFAASPVSADAPGTKYPGFTLIPPGGDRWKLVQQSASTLVWAKGMEAESASFLVAVLTGPTPGRLDDDEAFRNFVRERKEHNPDPANFTVQSELAPTVHPGPGCIRYKTRIKDRTMVARGRETLMLDVFGYACLHPDSPDRFFDIQYSMRYPAGTAIADSDTREGEAFLAGFRFAESPSDGRWALGNRPHSEPVREST